MKHSWSDKLRPDQRRTLQCCARCGLEKIGRHESGQHWIEWRKNGVAVKSDKTPACEPVEENASA